jgi:hypothetical protein
VKGRKAEQSIIDSDLTRMPVSQFCEPEEAHQIKDLNGYRTRLRERVTIYLISLGHS